MSIPKLIIQLPECTGYWTRWHCRRRRKRRTMKLAMTRTQANHRLKNLQILIAKLEEEKTHGGIPEKFDITTLD